MVVLRIEGELTDAKLRALETGLNPETRCVTIDWRNMIYSPRTRRRFSEWLNRTSLVQVAFVTTNPMWKMVVAAMSLSVASDLKVVKTLDEAEIWLSGESS